MKTGFKQRVARAVDALLGNGPAYGQRGYNGAKSNRLTQDFFSPITSADTELRTNLRVLRGRCRELERNNDYARRFFDVSGNNIFGASGVRLQMKSGDWGPQKGGGREWKLDKVANSMIEDAWNDFCNDPTACGGMTMGTFDRMTLRSVQRDGDTAIQLIRGYDNKYGFAILPLESDLIDDTINQVLPNGNQIRMGVEVDKYGKAVAYHMLEAHPGDTILWSTPGANTRRRVLASDVICPYIKDRPSQTRGVPWLVAAMSRLQMLNAYEEAELVAARVGASKMGFFVKSANSDQGYSGPADAQGNVTMDAEPGTFETLPYGLDFKQWDPQHPSGNYGPFIKAALRGVASSLGMSYNTLANDLENVNYSSIRAGLLEEREQWMGVQNWYIASVRNPIFTAWLEMAMMKGVINLPMAKFDKFNEPQWHPRRWSWVDPQKDITAQLMAINGGLRSRRGAIAEQGNDIENVFSEMEADNELADAMGLQFEVPLAKAEVVESDTDSTPENVDVAGEDDAASPPAKPNKPSKPAKPGKPVPPNKPAKPAVDAAAA